jgi:hypothetical protein
MAVSRWVLLVVAAGFAGVAGRTAFAQADVEGILNPQASVPAVDDEIIIRGRRGAELRLEIERAENAIFARFNAINSDDRFDIVCRLEPPIGSRIDRRVCSSNDWRDKAAEHGAALIRHLRNEGGPLPEMFLLEQQRGQRQLVDEMRRLVFSDETLYEAVVRYGKARMDLAEFSGSSLHASYSRQVISAEDSLPLDATRMFHVWIGSDRWMHPLAESTFGVKHISGKIRSLEIECDQGRERHKYEDNLAWTLPADWSGCVLLVDAKRKTHFALLELEQ